MQLFVNLVILLLAALTVWFFFIKNEAKVVKVKNRIRVLVDGGYQPESLEIPVGVNTTLEFLRKDPTSCLEEVVFPDFKIRQYLPLNTVVEVKLNPKKTGTFQFHCGMSMFFGKLIVV